MVHKYKYFTMLFFYIDLKLGYMYQYIVDSQTFVFSQSLGCITKSYAGL